MIQSFPNSFASGRRIFAVLASSLVIFSTVHAQDVQTRPGLVLIKPQAWSRPDEATLTEFVAFTDHTVQGTAGAGYYELKTKSNDKRQVQASKVVKFVIYPDLTQYPNIVNPEDRAELVKIDDELKGVIAGFPATKTYLTPYLKEVDGELAQFDGGKIKRDGVWQEKEAFVAGQLTTIGAQLKAAILRAKPVSKFDLANDPHFTALKESAGKSPSIQQLVNELTELYDKQVRMESRQDLVDRLSGNSINFSEAQGAVARLRSLHPEEDPRSVAFLRKWDSQIELVKTPINDAKPVADAIETQFKTIQTFNTPPEIAPEQMAKVQGITEKIRLFVVAQPIPAVMEESRQPVAIYYLNDGLTKLQQKFADKQLLEAKDILDPLTSKAKDVGPETARVVLGLQGTVSKHIDEFTHAREEANLLQQSGRPTEALAKFEEAFALMPDPTVGGQISKLKQTGNN